MPYNLHMVHQCYIYGLTGIFNFTELFEIVARKDVGTEHLSQILNLRNEELRETMICGCFWK